MYCDLNGKIFGFFNIFWQEYLLLHPIIILNTPFQPDDFKTARIPPKY